MILLLIIMASRTKFLTVPALAENVCSSAVVLNILARRRDPAPAITILTPDALRLRHEPQADCARYDSLRRAS
jgi:hypothetical protein